MTSNELRVRLTLRLRLNKKIKSIPEAFDARTVFGAAYQAMMDLDDNVVGAFPGGDYEVTIVFENCKSCKHKRRKSCPCPGIRREDPLEPHCDSWERKIWHSKLA